MKKLNVSRRRKGPGARRAVIILTRPSSHRPRNHGNQCALCQVHLPHPDTSIALTTVSLISSFSFKPLSFCPCIILHYLACLMNYNAILSKLLLLEEAGLMKPSWGKIIEWGGTVTTQNRSTEHQPNPHPWIVIDMSDIDQYANKSTLVTLTALQVLISHSPPAP